MFSSLSILQTYESDDEEGATSPSSSLSKSDYDLTSEQEQTSCFCLPEEPQTKRSRKESPSSTENVSKPNSSLTNCSGGAAGKLALPVPQNILEMFASSENNDLVKYNDPSLHMGRTRSFAHVRGNWASFLYLPCKGSYSKNNDEDHVLSNLHSLIDAASADFGGIHPIHSIDDKHVTLSRTLAFRHHWIEAFVNNIRNAVSRCQRIQLILEGFSIYVNDEKSRTFISMNVSTTVGLLNLVKICDECLAEYELPPYYEDPSFHISCAWMLGDKREWAESKLLPFLNNKWCQLMQKDTDMHVHTVDVVEFKTGNKLYRFPFNNGDQ